MISILKMPDHLKDFEVYFVRNHKTTKSQKQRVQFLHPQEVFFSVYRLTSSIQIPYQVLSSVHLLRSDWEVLRELIIFTKSPIPKIRLLITIQYIVKVKLIKIWYGIAYKNKNTSHTKTPTVPSIIVLLTDHFNIIRSTYYYRINNSGGD